ncbi:hypothetical protein JCM8097_008364 [Rhodosporidiobolus ruineniae]
MSGVPGGTGYTRPAHLEHPLYAAYARLAHQQHQHRQHPLYTQQQPAGGAAGPASTSFSQQQLATTTTTTTLGSSVAGLYANAPAYALPQPPAHLPGVTPLPTSSTLPSLALLSAVQQQPHLFPPPPPLPASTCGAGGTNEDFLPTPPTLPTSSSSSAALPPSSSAPPPSASPSTSTTALPTPPPPPAAVAHPTPAPLSGPGSRRRWTPAEDADLVRLVKEVPPLTWTQIGERMGRKGSGCGMRWYKVLRDRVAKEGGAVSQTDEAEREASSEAGGSSSADAVQPDSSMIVGSSTGLSASPSSIQAASSSSAPKSAPPPPPPHANPPAKVPRARKVISNTRTGVPVNLATVSAVPVPSPSANEAGHPLPLPAASSPSLSLTVPAPSLSPDPSLASPSTSTTAPHLRTNAGPQYLPDAALVKHPPIPFGPNTVLRGRRTKPVTELEREFEAVRARDEEMKRAREAARAAAAAAAVAEDGDDGGDDSDDAEGEFDSPAAAPIPAPPAAAPAGGGGDKPKKVKKRGTKVHVCPAENCGAAFKRSEHLRRHFKSVHRGEKPWPCTIEGCGKSFSRKDNLQQHQALVHYVRATYTYPDGSVSADPPSLGSSARVVTTFEAVEITRSAQGGPKISRARGKAVLPAAAGAATTVPVQDRGSHSPVPLLPLPTAPTAPLPPLSAPPTSSVMGLMSLSQLPTRPPLPSGGFSVSPSPSYTAFASTPTSAMPSGSVFRSTISDLRGSAGGGAGAGSGAGEKRTTPEAGLLDDLDDLHGHDAGGSRGRSGIDKRLRLTGVYDGEEGEESDMDAALKMLAAASTTAASESGGGGGGGAGAGGGGAGVMGLAVGGLTGAGGGGAAGAAGQGGGAPGAAVGRIAPSPGAIEKAASPAVEGG